MSSPEKTVQDYLTEPYTRVITPDAATGTYTAQVLEFPGCIAEGSTVEEAYARLEEAASSWLEAALDLGQDIPSPLLVHDYGGKVALRLPRSLHRQASMAAERDGISLNQFIVAAIAEKVGAANLYRSLTEKLEQDLLRAAVGAAVSTTTIQHTYYETDKRAANLPPDAMQFGMTYQRHKEVVH